MNGFYAKSDVEVMAFQRFCMKFLIGKTCAYLYVPCRDGFAGETVPKGYHRKGLVETIPTICEWFLSKSDVEVTAFQSFWYEFVDKHKVCIFCMCLVRTVSLTKPSQRDTIERSR